MRSGPWMVEAVLDTGQRIASVDFATRVAAQGQLDDMRSRTRVVAVALIDLGSGEVSQLPSRNLAAGVSWIEMDYRRERELLAEALR